jgi:predicted 3-demethylubiquinone-9 3-methyltransferase (glyoxalase superfamily)
MSTITPCLWFDGTAEEAAHFYASLLPDSHVDSILHAPGDYPSGKAGDVLTVEFGDVPAHVANGRALLINDYAASPLQARPPSPVTGAKRAA